MAEALLECVSPAATSHVSTWVHDLVGDVLEERARVVAEIERSSTRSRPPLASPAATRANAALQIETMPAPMRVNDSIPVDASDAGDGSDSGEPYPSARTGSSSGLNPLSGSGPHGGYAPISGVGPNSASGQYGFAENGARQGAKRSGAGAWWGVLALAVLFMAALGVIALLLTRSARDPRRKRPGASKRKRERTHRQRKQRAKQRERWRRSRRSSRIPQERRARKQRSLEWLAREQRSRRDQRSQRRRNQRPTSSANAASSPSTHPRRSMSRVPRSIAIRRIRSTKMDANISSPHAFNEE